MAQPITPQESNSETLFQRIRDPYAITSAPTIEAAAPAGREII
jgi:hypothetical protein